MPRTPLKSLAPPPSPAVHLPFSPPTHTPQISRKEEVPAGSEEEVEVRSGTVVAVERIREALAARFGGAPGAALPNAVQLDWWLWGVGERQRAEAAPHMRVLTIFY